METTNIICEFILSTCGCLWGYRSQINIGEILEDSIIQTKTKDDIISEITKSVRNDARHFPLLLEKISEIHIQAIKILEKKEPFKEITKEN